MKDNYSYDYTLQEYKSEDGIVYRISIMPSEFDANVPQEFLLDTALQFIEAGKNIRYDNVVIDEEDLDFWLEDVERQVTFMLQFYKRKDVIKYLNELRDRFLI